MSSSSETYSIHNSTCALSDNEPFRIVRHKHKERVSYPFRDPPRHSLMLAIGRYAARTFRPPTEHGLAIRHKGI